MRTSGPGSGSIRLWGASRAGTSRTSSRPSCHAASEASTRWPMCGGLKAPPRIPTAATAPLPPDLPVAMDDVLGGGQLAQPDGAAGVELLRGVADLGTHPELEAVREAGRGVDVHAGRVDAVR